MAQQLTLTLVGESERALDPVDVDAIRSKPYLIGRDPAATLFLNDPTVSRSHCRIFVENGRVLLEDLGSRAGTTLNGRPLSRPHAIRDGDAVSVGDLQLRVKLDPPQVPAEAPAASYSNEFYAVGAETLPPRRPAHAAGPIMDRESGADGADSDGDGGADGRAAVAGGRVPGGARDSATVVSRGRPKPQVPDDATGGISVLLRGDAVTIGRDAGCTLHLDSPAVSRQHARISKAKGSWAVEDLKSANGTFVNGLRVTKPRTLAPGDVLTVGTVRLTFEGTRLVSRRSEGGTRIAVRGLGKQVKDRQTGQPLWLLRDINLTIEPREFVGLMGGSGCGKSTFMDTVNGRRPATHGEVLYDGVNLYQQFDSLKAGIGYVPQDVIFHEHLPLEDALRYSAQLRLPRDTSDGEIDQNITRVLKTVGLLERRTTLIKDLSGGQKKRVSIAMELLSRPQVLFLDEVTSGLDLGTERQMMQLFRNLADDGLTVVCITHHVDSLEMCDMVAYFTKGRLAFYGPPDVFKEYFGLEEIREIYDAESAKPPAEWERQFRRSPEHREFVVARERGDRPAASSRDTLGDSGGDAGAVPAAAVEDPFGQRKKDFVRQFKVLMDRYLKLLTLDRGNLLLLLNLAPLVGLLLCIVSASIGAPSVEPAPVGPPPANAAGPGADPQAAAAYQQAQATYASDLAKYASKQNILCFGSIMTILFLGLFGSIREIVKELTIYRHERFINLQVLPYLLSKAAPLAVLGAVQALMLTLIVNQLGGLEAGGIGHQFLILFLTSLVGTMMGLAISAAVPSADWAVILMIAIVIPQMLFSGALVPAKGWSGVIAKAFIPAYWAQESLTGLLSVDVQKLLDSNTVSGGDAWLSSALVLPLHALLYGVVAWACLVAKDGRGALGHAMTDLHKLMLAARASKKTQASA